MCQPLMRGYIFVHKLLKTYMSILRFERHSIEYQDAFHLFDRDGNGKVSSDELGPLMRSLGSNPQDDHLQELINEVDYEGELVLYKLNILRSCAWGEGSACSHLLAMVFLLCSVHRRTLVIHSLKTCQSKRC